MLTKDNFAQVANLDITHPVAVASIIAEMHLDHEAVMAALLHDVIEDTPLYRIPIKKMSLVLA